MRPILRYAVGLAAGSTLLLAPPGAGAQSVDGTYDGTISCGLLTHLTRGLQTPLTMTVTGNEVRYERQILSRGNPTGYSERGSGTVTASGEVALRGKGEGPDYSFDGEYRGQLSGNPIQLVGTQRWRVRGKAPEERSCQIDLTLSQPKS